jgi:hypothetical protein
MKTEIRKDIPCSFLQGLNVEADSSAHDPRDDDRRISRKRGYLAGGSTTANPMGGEMGRIAPAAKGERMMQVANRQ